VAGLPWMLSLHHLPLMSLLFAFVVFFRASVVVCDLWCF
jgi:hypothetical protein